MVCGITRAHVRDGGLKYPCIHRIENNPKGLPASGADQSSRLGMVWRAAEGIVHNLAH